MTISKEELRENYSHFSDSKILKLATEETASLSEEAKKVLDEELKKRDIGISLQDSLELQQKQISKTELLNYCTILSELACPICKREHRKLNATLTVTVTSIIFITNYEKQVVIACQECLNKKVLAANWRTLLLGWWAFPFGIFRTIEALIHNFTKGKTYLKSNPSNELKLFASANSAKIEVFKNDVKQLQKLINLL
jgi:hypothetical protein